MPGRLTWRLARVNDIRAENARARTVQLSVSGWPGHAAGQHVDVRLTAPDGYTATRAYSIASAGIAASDSELIELTVESVPGGEVSSYLVDGLEVGTELEVRGPLGGWFVWRPEQQEPVQLIAGGSGLVPLMAMLRTRAAAGVHTPMRLLYSVRDPAALLYRQEVQRYAEAGDGLAVSIAYTRTAPPGAARPVGRVDGDYLATLTIPPASQPTCYVCGPTGFVEAITGLLVDAGHDPTRIRAERFGPSGGDR